MKAIYLAAVSGVFVLGVCAACNSSSGSTTNVVTSLDSGRTLASLSDSEATGYCHDLQNYFTSSLAPAEMKEVSCVIAASFAQFEQDLQTARSKCAEIYNQCVAADAPDGGGLVFDAGPSPDSCTNAKANFGDCTATVGDVNACEQDEVSVEKSLLRQAPAFCNTLQQTDAGIGYAHTELPASCASLQAKCPNAFKVTSGGGKAQ